MTLNSSGDLSFILTLPTCCLAHPEKSSFDIDPFGTSSESWRIMTQYYWFLIVNVLVFSVGLCLDGNVSVFLAVFSTLNLLLVVANLADTNTIYKLQS